MGHMDDDNIEHYTVYVRQKTGDPSPEIYNSATDVEEDGERLEFKDKNGKSHVFWGVSYHVAGE